MSDRIAGKIAGIIRYAEKGKAGTPLQNAELRQDWGMEGDFHADGGERQLSLLSHEARLWIRAQAESGLCFARFKENLSLDGIPTERLKAGTRLRAGQAVLEISAYGKRCYPECPLFLRGSGCRLSSEGVFARVVKGGSIRVGDFIGQEDIGMEQALTHFDGSGNAVMVDVSGKEATSRVAVAKGRITMNERTFNAVSGGTAAKGDVLGVARVAGIMAAKKTSDLIPMCHPLMLDTCTVDFELLEDERAVETTCTVKTSGKTGVEMEAITGVTVALLTVYDMCKAMDRAMEIVNVRLCEKHGGKSGHYVRGI